MVTSVVTNNSHRELIKEFIKALGIEDSSEITDVTIYINAIDPVKITVSRLVKEGHLKELTRVVKKYELEVREIDQKLTPQPPKAKAPKLQVMTGGRPKVITGI